MFSYYSDTRYWAMILTPCTYDPITATTQIPDTGLVRTARTRTHIHMPTRPHTHDAYTHARTHMPRAYMTHTYTHLHLHADVHTHTHARTHIDPPPPPTHTHSLILSHTHKYRHTCTRMHTYAACTHRHTRGNRPAVHRSAGVAHN